MTDESLPAVPYKLDGDIGALVEAQLNHLAKPRTGPPRPSFHLESNAVHRYQMQAAVEGHRFLSDEERKVGGTGTGPAPLRYFVAGVVMCVEVWVVKLAGHRNIPLSGLHVAAEAFLEEASDDTGDLQSGRGFDRITLDIEINTELGEGGDDTATTLVRDAFRACPAAVTAARATSLEVSIAHNGKALTKTTL